MDERRDSGEYYPGGRRGGEAPEIAGNGKVDRVNIEEVPERYTEADMRATLNRVVRALRPIVTCIALCEAACGATVEVQTAPKGEIYNDERIVTNVVLDVGDKADRTNTYTKAETDARIVELAPPPGNYNAVSNRAMRAALLDDSRLPYTDDNHNYYFETFLWRDPASIYSRSFRYSKAPAAFVWWLPDDAPDGISYLASTNYVDAAMQEAVWQSYDYVDNKVERIDADLAQKATTNETAETRSIVDTWESYWGATNVELSVSNFYGNTTGALPRLRIREFRDGHWTNVWDEIDKFIACKAEILHEVAQSNATLLAEADRKYAPKAWGSHTDKGTTNVIPNSVYMTSPETYFGGGTEFQRVAVGSGAVSVLVDRGALAKTTGEPGTFRFQDAGGTNYFGFVKSDSYTIGCRTDGISVGAGNAITLRYDVIMSGEDVPIVYWKQKLESATPWAQLNNADGTAADGAPYSVTWLQDGGSYYATVNCGGSPGGFFVAETSVAGDVVWETNMKARLGGGIECTNTATHVNGVIRPSYNGSTVTWEWRAR